MLGLQLQVVAKHRRELGGSDHRPASIAPHRMPAVSASPPFSRPLLVLDAASPRPSAAVAQAGELLGVAEAAMGGPAAPAPAALAAAAVGRAGLAPRDLGGVIAVRGPGSFTGLRVALASAWALHQALGIPAAAITTFEALALQLPAEAFPALALIDALRGEWFAQLFAAGAPPEPRNAPDRLPLVALAALGARTAIGFGESAPPGGLVADRWIAAVPLAGPAARWLSLHPPVWEPSLLLQPLYLRAPTPEVRLGAAPDDRPA